jgi:vacuolar protein sorting-associated protein 54
LVGQIKTLRKDLALLDEGVVTKGRALLQKRQTHCHLQQLNDAVLQLKRIVDGVAYCQSLADQGEAEKALAEIDANELLMAGERNRVSADETLTHVRLRDIRAAAASQWVASDLTILRFRIGKVFETQVHSLLIEDLRRHVRSISTQEVFRR